MADPETLDQEITELESRLTELRRERELVEKRVEVLEELKRSIDDTLAANGLAVQDLLELYKDEIARMGGRRRRRAATGKRARKAATPKTRVRIKGVGDFELASRGKLPEALKAFMDENGLDRTAVIEKYGVSR